MSSWTTVTRKKSTKQQTPESKIEPSQAQTQLQGKEKDRKEEHQQKRNIKVKEAKGDKKKEKRKERYSFVDVAKVLEHKPVDSVFTLRRPNKDDYPVPPRPEKLHGVPSLKEITMNLFVTQLRTNAIHNIPALLSLPPNDFEKIITIVMAQDSVEFRVGLYEYQLQNKKVDSRLPKITLRDVAESIAHYERRFLSYQLQGEENLKLLEPNLIDVWANYETFRLRPPSSAENGIFGLYYGNTPYRPPPGSFDEPSLTDRKTFLRRFKVFTDGMLEGWKQWNNMVVVGGSVQACLVHVPANFSKSDDTLFDWYHRKKYVQSDIDICLYGLTDQQFTDKVYALYTFFKKTNQVLVVRTKYTVTFCFEWPRRHVQIVLARWGSIQELIQESDVDCSAVAFDGKRVWTTQRGRFSYNHRSVIVTQKSFQSRGSPEYESRLMKFSRRGFYIWDMDFSWDMMSERYLKMGILFLTSNNTTIRPCGLRLLLCGIKFNKEIFAQKEGEAKPSSTRIKNRDLFVDKDIRFKDTGLPYGPAWTHKRIKNHVRYLEYPTDNYGYIVNERNVYSVISTVRDQQSIISFQEKHKNSEFEQLLSHDRSGDINWHHEADALMTPSHLGYSYHRWHEYLLLKEDIEELNDGYHLPRAEACENATADVPHGPIEYCEITPKISYTSEVKYLCHKCFHKRRSEDSIPPHNVVYKIPKDFLRRVYI